MKKYTSLALFALLIVGLSVAPSPREKRAEAYVKASPVIYSLPVYDTPSFLYIPSMNLFSPIQGVGVNTIGNMDVPSGKTNNVGWYQYGTAPGNIGTAVLDAHNTAAFKHLHVMQPGDSIYVLTQSGKFLHFVVNKATTYSMKTLTSETLFSTNGTRKLNLITCAGGLLPDGTADSRLIVSAQLL